MHDSTIWLAALPLVWALAALDADPAKAPATIQVLSNAFANGGIIPARFTCDGPNISPQLSWSGIPPGAKSLAVLCDDPDAPVGTWDHWVLYDLPAADKELPEGVQASAPGTARHGLNGWNKPGYCGPCPPPGKAHRYFFRVYALDATLELPAGATKAQVVAAMKGHVLARGEIVGSYARKA